MKLLLYIFLLFTTLVHAQDQRLFNTQWRLLELTVSNVSYPPPNNQEVPFVPINFDEPNGVLFSTYVCGGSACAANGTFIGMDQMSITSIACFSGGCNTASNVQYNMIYDNFFRAHPTDPIFQYSIGPSTIGNELILIITNYLGDTAIYLNDAASIRDISQHSISLYPNPVSNELFIKTENEFLPASYEIFNLAGQLIKASDLTSEKINVSDMQIGRYFIRLSDLNGDLTVSSFLIKR
jgi:hypothetical protein